ncbi:MAG: hypothetical protein RL304_920 [Verrucomicrobiota bacterium]
MSLLRLFCLCALATTACTGQTAADKPAAQPTPSPMKETTEAAPNVIIHTNYGDMTVEFWPDVAPKTVANFLKLSREGYYTGTAFHRIIKGFMIQGGCPNSKVGARGVAGGVAGTGGPGYQIKAEFNNRAHVRGVLSMARSADPDSAGSQFFICHGNADFLNTSTPPSASWSPARTSSTRSRPSRASARSAPPRPSASRSSPSRSWAKPRRRTRRPSKRPTGPKESRPSRGGFFMPG